jgi:biopolymer transport protein ExbB
MVRSNTKYRVLALIAIFALLTFPSTAQEPAVSQQPPAIDSSQAPPVTAVTNAVPNGSQSVATPPLPHNLSPWGMFVQADVVVKTVMLGLAFASLLTWTILLAKSLQIIDAKRRAKAAQKVISQTRTLSEAVKRLAGKTGTGVMLAQAADEEVQLSLGALAQTDGSGLKERVTSRLSRIESAAGRRLSRGTGLLATIGSTAPFVGLFGTVWGIMNAFIGISQAQTTNLAVVAPGIAEALLATAMGLVAAIPAVVVYNVFARSITSYRHQLGDLAATIERLISRDLDYRDISEPR